MSLLLQIVVIAYIIKLINIVLFCMMAEPSSDYIFYYFAYGSNMLKRRILLNNPSAVFFGFGRLNVITPLRLTFGSRVEQDLENLNHRLDFVKVPYYNHWGGAVATVVPDENKHVWGAVWKMQNESLVTLDKQEGVEDKQYFPKEVYISDIDGQKKKCRTYQHVVVPPYLKSLLSLPDDRKPSITYKKCFVNGALECDLPNDYIEMLKSIPDNGRQATADLRKRLDL